MGISMDGRAAEQKNEKRNRIIRIFAIALGLVSFFSFLFPYMVFVFRGRVYTLTGLQLITVEGMWAVGPQESGLVTIPLLMRLGVMAGSLLTAAAIVLLLLKKPVWAGAAYMVSGLSPLLVLIATSNIQTAVTQLNISQVEVNYLWPFLFVIVSGILCAVFSLWTQGTERLAESIFLVFACVSVGSVALITIYIITAGAPAMISIGAGNFLFGEHWQPKSDIYGIFPMILSSILGTFGAILIGVPIGILAAVFLSETAAPLLAKLVRPAIELLAGIPSVVYGFFGMLVIVPAIRTAFPGKTIGDSLLAVIIILAIMVLPTIVSVTETSLQAVPQAYREASLALGATPTTTIFKVTIPAARSGILAGVILGVGRAIGETMAVIMVAGNVANMPSLLGTVRMLTTGIAMEMSYASGLHRQALFAIGLVLFFFIMIVNISFAYLSRKGVQMDAE